VDGRGVTEEMWANPPGVSTTGIEMPTMATDDFVYSKPSEGPAAGGDKDMSASTRWDGSVIH